jgi:hypothetical protein
MYQQPPGGNQYPTWYAPQPIAQWQALAQAQAANPPWRAEPQNPTLSSQEQGFRPILPVVGVGFPMLPYGTRSRYF